MIKEIRYGGYTANPSDYDAPDGDLDIAVNVINENGALRPLFQPSQHLRLGTCGHYSANDNPPPEVMLIHKVSGQTNYIVRSQIDGENKLYWFKYEQFPTGADDRSAELITSFSSSAILDSAIMGNTIVLSLDAGIRYLIWRDNGYAVLGARPPEIPIDFSLIGAGNYVEVGKTWNVPTDTDDFANHVFGIINSIAADVNNAGLFFQPFFVRYAVRLYDGSYVGHSAPKLMMFDIRVPGIFARQGKSHIDSDVYGYALGYSILDFDLDAWKLWEGIVTGIDIFVSAPIYTYNQAGKIPKDVTGELHNQFVNHRNKAINLNDGIVGVKEDGTPLTDNGNPQAFSYWNVPANENFKDDIENVGLFYHIRSLSFDEIIPRVYKKRVNIEDEQFNIYPKTPKPKTVIVTPSSLVNRPRLPDDFRSRHNVIPKKLFAFNNRLNAANLMIEPPVPGIPIDGAITNTPNAKVEVSVFLQTNGSFVISNRSYHRSYNIPADSSGFDKTCSFIYYPDADAYRMDIKIIAEGSRPDAGAVLLDKSYRLTPSPALNGAYWWIGGGALEPDDAADAALGFADHIEYSNKLQTSEVNNCFYFPTQNISTIGNGAIVGVSAPVQALSQGQFGQFPLYAFCTDGVWAMETGDNGSFFSRQPVSRDVCVNPKAITQIDSAVIYPASRGLMILSGSQSVCISDTLFNDYDKSDVLLRLPHLSDILKKHRYWFGEGQLKKFTRDFLSSASIVYDYVNQLLIICDASQPVGDGYGDNLALVYSFKSRCWASMNLDMPFTHALNSYPEAYAAAGSCVLDFTNTNPPVSYPYFVTRPLKLDDPDVLKTVDTVIQRGDFPKDAVGQLLYGSRDLRSWHLVWSSKDKYLRGFRGTPYKYFRIAVIAELHPGDSISGASVRFTTRLTDQPR